ncbi:hypothetical protein [Salinibaculum rarum]|uniref:hypothetical protein n=1 Tax=Salinibaculum rarum TaxID=3058903 RepID=UPI00265FE062|nr:hypothetical protein [Salinibaculum sp. KK48]
MTADTDEPEVPIVCEVCGTETTIPLSDVGEMLETHNENQHDGEEHAQVDPTLAEQVQDLVAEDMGLLE